METIKKKLLLGTNKETKDFIKENIQVLFL